MLIKKLDFFNGLQDKNGRARSCPKSPLETAGPRLACFRIEGLEFYLRLSVV